MAITHDHELNIVYTNEKLLVNSEFKKYIDLDYTIERLVNMKEAYIVVTDIRGDKFNLKFTVKIYTNALKNVLLDTEEYNFIPSNDENSERWDKQAYQYLKTLPKYENSIDC